MESDLRRQHQQQMSSGLSRDSSAPSSYLSSFVDVVGGGGGGNAGGRAEHEQYFNGQSPSPETERIIARFMLEETQFDLQMGFMKREDEDLQKQNVFSPSSPVLYQNTSRLPFPTQNPPPSSSETEPSYASLVSSPVNHRIASLNVNGSNLTRHRSSPAGFFVNMDIDKGKPPPPPSSSSSSSSSGKHSPCENRAYPNISMGSWDGPEITHKRSRDNDRTSFSGLDASEDHQRESETPSLSLPTTEMSAMERYLQFQDSVPCKIRAKRGMATHPRSIAERVRRTRISERMRKLQELVPNMDKQTSTADMLDLAVDYIKGLQKQVKTLSEARSSCSCTRSSLDSEG